jgi:hypothetical protein
MAESARIANLAATTACVKPTRIALATCVFIPDESLARSMFGIVDDATSILFIRRNAWLDLHYNPLCSSNFLSCVAPPSKFYVLVGVLIMAVNACFADLAATFGIMKKPTRIAFATCVCIPDESSARGIFGILVI